MNVQPSGSSEDMDVDHVYSILQAESANQSQQADQEIKILNTDKGYKELLSSMQQEKGN